MSRRIARLDLLVNNASAAPDGIKVNSVNPGLVSTDLSHHMGTRTPAQGAEVIVRFATLGEECPSGTFFAENGPIPW